MAIPITDDTVHRQAAAAGLCAATQNGHWRFARKSGLPFDEMHPDTTCPDVITAYYYALGQAHYEMSGAPFPNPLEGLEWHLDEMNSSGAWRICRALDQFGHTQAVNIYCNSSMSLTASLTLGAVITAISQDQAMGDQKH